MKPSDLIAGLTLLGAACSSAEPAPTASTAPTAVQVRELLGVGSGSNYAATADSSSDPRVRPRILGGAPAAVRQALETGIAGNARWTIRAADDSVIWATRTTRVFRWVDDIFILLTPVGDSTRVDARSASRVGKGDLGQNRRNLAELWAAVESDIRR